MREEFYAHYPQNQQKKKKEAKKKKITAAIYLLKNVLTDGFFDIIKTSVATLR